MSGLPVTIRAAVEEDFGVMTAIFNAARESARLGGGPAGQDRLRHYTEGEEIHVAILADEVVGFVSVWPAERFVHHLYVAPDCQSRGIGRALLARCEERYGLPLSLKCETANIRALRFYERLGWAGGEAGVGPDGEWRRMWLHSRDTGISSGRMA
jgi:ribosomal protein S18 acetylase RimI-like enzyme